MGGGEAEGALDGVAVGGDCVPVEGGAVWDRSRERALAGPGLQQSRRQASVMSPADGGFTGKAWKGAAGTDTGMSVDPCCCRSPA